MKLIQDTSFKGIKTEYLRLDKQYRSPSSNQAGFMKPTFEKALKRSVKYFRTKSNGLGNLASLKELAFKTKGDLNKLPPNMKKVLDQNYKQCKDWMKEFKSDNITEGSFLRLYVDAYDILNNPKNKIAFGKAIEYERKLQAGGPSKSNLIVLGCLLYILYIVLVFFLTIACFALILDTLSFTSKAREGNVLDQKMFETIIESVTSQNRSMMLQVGFTTINAIFYINSHKDLNKELEEGFKKEKEALTKFKKGRESGNIDYYDIKDTGVSLVNNSGLTQSKESAVLIVALSLMGVILVVSLVRRSIYWIGALKIDIIKLFMIEAETLSINIIELERKRDSTTNESEKKRLDKIIQKQKAVLENLRSRIDRVVSDSNQAYYEVEDQVEVEDREIERDESTNDEDYDIIL